MAVQRNVQTRSRFPTGPASERHVKGRQRRGNSWLLVFMASTLLGIVALVALLYNVINSAFGYVIMQNERDPQAIVQTVEEGRVLAAAALTSEDDEELAAALAGNPDAVGFFGFAYLQEHTDTLRAVAVDGVQPSVETVNAGEYPLARPLYIYVAADALAEKPQVAALARFYLENVNAVVEEVGYFPATDGALAAGLARWAEVTGLTAMPDPADEPITIVGSSTVFPLTQRVLSLFHDQGYDGAVRLENTGTRGGFVQFCSGADVDIVNASRPLSRSELEACADNDRTAVEFRVGTDGMAVVVSRENSFLQNVTLAQLAQIFTDAAQWSAVDGDWPATPIARLIPGADSGTLDYFVESVLDRPLAELPKETLIGILQDNVSAGLMRRFENDRPFAERSQNDVYELVLERVVNPTIVESFTLRDSWLRQSEIEAQVATVPNGTLEFRSWVTADFILSPQSSRPEFAGVRTAILGSLWVILITILFSLPIGVGAAVYLEEYAEKNRFNQLIETNINNLAGVPSIIYGMLGLAIFVRTLEVFTSGRLFGIGDDTTANGRTILSAGLTLGLLILPLLIINAREAIRAVPASLRQAAYGLGATKWQTVWSHVLPSALPGILTGTILAISRAIGETAPLVVIGASTFIVVDPEGAFSKFTTLPIQIYQWTSRPQAEFRNLAAAAIIVLLVMLLSLNAAAVALRNRFATKRA